jgi:VWFA-related protein
MLKLQRQIRPFFFILFLAAVCLSAQQAGQPAQQPTPGPAATQSGGTFPAGSLKVTTRMVLVDAVVTNNSGDPVTGLQPSDFVVLENGRQQVIRAFGARETMPAGRTQFVPWVMPPNVFTNIPDINLADGPPTVVLIDALNTLTKDQPYMRQQLVNYLKNMGSRHNVAIYTLGSRLRLVQDFTTDPAVLQEALKKVTMHSSMLNQDPNSSDDPFGDLSSLAAQSITDFQAEEAAFMMDIRVNITVEALKSIGRNVAGFPGRKNLIWLSGAFPFYLAPDSGLTNPFVAQRQYAGQIQGAATILTDSQVAVYPVDARGLVGSLMPDASVRGPSGRNPGPAIASQMARASADLQSSHDSMNEIAQQTGGRAFYNRNDIDHAIALSVQDGGSYYSIGYYPEDKHWDGKFRKIEVKLTRKDLHVRSRRGYFATAGTAPYAVDDKAAQMEFLGAMALESPTATMLPFVARVVLPTKLEPAVSIHVGVDPRSVLFESPGDNLQHAKIDFFTYAFDKKGKMVTNAADTVTTALKPDTYAAVMASRLELSQKLTLAPGKYTLKIGVRDVKTRLIGTATASIEVPQD